MAAGPLMTTTAARHNRAKRFVVARHEAAHCIAAASLGWEPPKRIVLGSRGDPRSYNDRGLPQARAGHHAMVYLAGLAVDVLHGVRAADVYLTRTSRPGRLDDAEAAWEAVRHHEGGYELSWRMARRLVNEHRDEVDRLAERLMPAGLAGVELAAAITEAMRSPDA